MKSTISISDYAIDLVDEQTAFQSAIGFSYTPTPPITVIELDMNIRDEYNGWVDIKLSNGDRIIYDIHEVFEPSLYKFSYSVNGEVLTNDLDDVLNGNTLIDSILDYYINTYSN